MGKAVFLTIEEVVFIHNEAILASGGSYGVHSWALLHSAIERPKASFAGTDLYPTIWMKAAALLHSLVKNHAFSDGNKRTAVLVTWVFLNKNKSEIDFSTQEIIDFALQIANDQVTLEEIAEWLEAHGV